ncbi:MFS transporter [Nocardia sp. NPDC052112]|uniref:MFS transporter n=1 Tax=Nocardia sp. NPDC052112 TaxID=3155646 RepID=UPI0034121213
MTAEYESSAFPAHSPSVVSAAQKHPQDSAERVTRPWTAMFGLAWLGYWAANLVPLQLLIPEQLEAIAPESKVFNYAVINGISGIVALIALPVCGALCDRTRNRVGRRRTWLGLGAVAFACGLIATGEQTSVVGLSVAWSATMLGLSAATAGLTATMADRVPVSQRGAVSSAIYGPQALGVAAGIAIVSAFSLSSAEGYVVLAVLLLACTAPFLLAYRDVASGHEPVLHLAAVARSMGRSLKNREFSWAFTGRLMVNLANSLGTCYMLYFLTDGLEVANPESALLGVTVVYLLAGISATVIFGTVSDRLGRRRIFIAAAAIFEALAGFLLASLPSVPTVVVTSALMGAGFGAYMAVHQALVTEILPDAESRAQDLGIMNIGTFVPPTVAPLLASFMITSSHSYPMLFAAVGVTAAIGAALTCKIRTVR